MNLGELAGIKSDSTVTGFAIDHRKVVRGNVFGAFRGSRFNVYTHGERICQSGRK